MKYEPFQGLDSGVDKIELRMRCCHHYLLVINLILFFFSFSLEAQVPTSKIDLLPLLSFKSQISEDPFQILSSWNDSVHYCQWQGVMCGRRHPNRVTALVLGSKQLSEYGTCGQPSTEGDVYSFGILLLEMFTGISPIDESISDCLSLYKQVEMAFPEQVMDMADKQMLTDIFEDDNIYAHENVYDCLVSVFKCGLLCSKESPKERISIKDVAQELTSARRMLLES